MSEKPVMVTCPTCGCLDAVPRGTQAEIDRLNLRVNQLEGECGHLQADMQVARELIAKLWAGCIIRRESDDDVWDECNVCRVTGSVGDIIHHSDCPLHERKEP